MKNQIGKTQERLSYLYISKLNQSVSANDTKKKSKYYEQIEQILGVCMHACRCLFYVFNFSCHYKFYFTGETTILKCHPTSVTLSAKTKKI